MVLRFICGLVAIAATAGVAVGQDSDTTNYDWSGIYMGLHGGFGWGPSRIEEDSFNIQTMTLQFSGDSFTHSEKLSGGLGGVQLGMNKQFAHIVIGSELRLSGAQVEGASSVCSGLVSSLVTFECKTTVNWMATATARLGYAQDRWLGYGLLGWSIAGVSYDSLFASTDPSIVATLPGGENDTNDGLAFGGGIEYALPRGVSIGVEYTRANLNTQGSGIVLGGTLSAGDRDIHLNTVTGRLNLRWGGSD